MSDSEFSRSSLQALVYLDGESTREVEEFEALKAHDMLQPEDLWNLFLTGLADVDPVDPVEARVE